MWNGFWRYRYLLWNLVSRDFKLKYRRSVLGVVWSVLNPLLMCLAAAGDLCADVSGGMERPEHRRVRPETA